MTTATEFQASIIDLINNLSRGFIREFNTRLNNHNVTYAQWRFLLSLWQNDGLTQKALSQRAGIEPATTVRTLDRMERDGLIVRKRSETDRREINIYLTEKGKTLQPTLKPVHQILEEQVSQSLEPQELKEFKLMLLRLLNQVPAK